MTTKCGKLIIQSGKYWILLSCTLFWSVVFVTCILAFFIILSLQVDNLIDIPNWVLPVILIPPTIQIFVASCLSIYLSFTRYRQLRLKFIRSILTVFILGYQQNTPLFILFNVFVMYHFVTCILSLFKWF